MKILIVDDAKSVHLFMDSLFNQTSHSLVHVMNGKEAVDLINEKASEIDLVLLDWEMPVMNGLETLIEIKKKSPKTPIIMVTSKSSASNIATILENGASEYIMKPFTKDILFEKIEDVLEVEV